MPENIELAEIVPEKKKIWYEVIDVLPAEVIDVPGVNEPNKNVTYLRFWIICCVALLNFSNTCQWIAFAPVGNYVNAHYGEGSASWFSLIYMLVTIPMGFVGMWLGGTYGLKVSCRLAAIFNFVGAIFRLGMDSLHGFKYHFHLAILGQAIAAMAYPFIMFLPSKVSADWFPSNERTTATTIGVMANPLGVLIVNFVVPYIVQSSNEVHFLNIILTGLCLGVGVLVLFSILDDYPKEYPAIPVEEEKQLSFPEGLRKCLKDKTYLLLFLSLGGGIGMFNCLYTMMQEMMCPAGYGNHTAGYCAIAMILFGIIGAVLGGIAVDRYPNSCKRILVAAMSLAVLFGVSFLQLSRIPGLVWVLGIVASLFGIAGLAVYPIGLELASETTYPVAPETASGLIVLMGQVLSVIFVMIFKFFAIPMSAEEIEQGDQKCKLFVEDAINVPKDFLRSIWIVTIIACSFPIMMAFIEPVKARINLERENMTKKSAEKKSAKKKSDDQQTPAQIAEEVRQAAIAAGLEVETLPLLDENNE